MSVLLPADRLAWWAPARFDCYFCTEPLAPDDVGVFWHSVGGAIVLHFTCAERLGLHLVQDAREARLAAGAPHWRARAARLVRFVLECQERSA